MKHTPGPWRWLGSTLTAGKNGTYLLYTREAPGLGAQAEPNYNLIATAPELLEVAETLLTFLKGTIERAKLDDPNGIAAWSEAVIAKAKGTGE
jgi:hypothetical protein